MRRARSLLFAALAVSAPLAFTRAVDAQRPVRATADAGGEDPYEGDGNALRRFQYFYDQRAYPFTRIPMRPTRAQMRAFRAPPALGGRFRADVVPNDASTWSSVGPSPIGSAPANSGRVTAIALDPHNPNVIYVGAAQGGVWKSVDGGSTFTPLTDDQCSLATGAVTVDPVNSNIVYVGTGEANFSGDSYYGCGILRSTDGGATWTQIGASVFDLPNGGAVVSRIWVDPQTAGSTNATLLAATSFGLWRSTDGGTTWVQVLSPGYGFVTDVVSDPTNPAVLYAAGTSAYSNSTNGVYKSVNGGATWAPTTPINVPGGTVGRIALATSPAAGGSLWAMVHNASTGNLGGVFRSDDGGQTWTTLPLTTGALACNTQCWYDLTIAVDPTNANNIYIGTVTLQRSTDGGQSFTTINGGTHVDQHALVVSPFDPQTIYAGNDGGISRSTNGGTSWTSLNGTLTITQFYPGAQILSSRGALDLTGGSQDNGTMEYSGSAAWTPIWGGDGGFTILDSANVGRAFVESQWVANSGYSGPYRRDVANGGFLQRVTGIDARDNGLFIPPLVMHESHPTTEYFGTTRLYRTRNAGDQWTRILDNGLAEVSAIAGAASDSATVYVGLNNGGVLVTHDDGTTWTTGTGVSSRYVTDFAVHRSNPRIAYVTKSGFGAPHVYKTTDGGRTWNSVSGNLPDVPVNAIVLLPGGELDVGTDIGVFRSADDGATWTPFTSRLPNVAVLDLQFDPLTGTLLAATHGRGMWTAHVNIVAPPALLAVDSTPPSVHNGLVARTIVSVRDVTGSRASSTVTITARLAAGTGALSGRLTAAASNGIAVFDSLAYSGTDAIQLAFDAPGLATVTTASVVNTLDATVTLDVRSRHTTAIVTSAAPASDSAHVQLLGSNASSVTWSATHSAAWATSGSASGVGSGTLSWNIAASSLAAGRYVDTITVTAAARNSPIVLLDTLDVVAAPTVAISFSPDTIAGGDNALASSALIASVSGAPLAVGKFSSALAWDSTLVRLDSARAGDLGAVTITRTNAGAATISAGTTNPTPQGATVARLFWSFPASSANGVQRGAITLASLATRSTVATSSIDLSPWSSAQPGTVSVETGLRGDVNGDGVVNAADAAIILRAAVGASVPAGTRLWPNGDANCDGAINAADAQIVLAYAAGKPVGNACVGHVR